MPDISLCQNEACPLKETCYRYTATPNKKLQAYGWFKPDEEGKCDHYLNYNEYKDEKRV